MKGIVFSEFMDLVEESFGLEMIDELIEQSDLPSGGSYTAVGTYPHGEMLTLVVKLAELTQIPVSDLLNKFGHNLYVTFKRIILYFFKK